MMMKIDVLICLNSVPFLLVTELFYCCSHQLTKAYQTATVLFEVLRAVNLSQSVEVEQEVKYI
jgi:hypothetical protein